MNVTTLAHPLLGLLLAPLMVGVVNRTKAVAAGRHGPPLLQPYFDLVKLLGKDAVYSRTTTWVFRAGPVIGLAVLLVALGFLPFANSRAAIMFPGDFIFLVYLLGLMRFFLVAAALDTGSSFEGMGASREVTFSVLVEPALLIGILAMTRNAGTMSLSGIYERLDPISLVQGKGPMLLLVAAAFMLIYLSENSRIPFDDPNTHLELTMIHEVMVLDHSGPDLALIEYTAALKLWLFGALIVGILVPFHAATPWLRILVALAGMFALAVATGVIESIMARLRLVSIPQLLVAAAVLSVLALILVVA